MRIVITDIPAPSGKPKKIVLDDVDTIVLGTKAPGADAAVVTCNGNMLSVAKVAAAVFGHTLGIIPDGVDRLAFVYDALGVAYEVPERALPGKPE